MCVYLHVYVHSNNVMLNSADCLISVYAHVYVCMYSTICVSVHVCVFVHLMCLYVCMSVHVHR